MRPPHLLGLFAIFATLLSGCAARIEKGEAAPLAPADGSDRASASPSTRVEVAGLPDWRKRLAAAS